MPSTLTPYAHREVLRVVQFLLVNTKISNKYGSVFYKPQDLILACSSIGKPNLASDPTFVDTVKEAYTRHGIAYNNMFLLHNDDFRYIILTLKSNEWLEGRLHHSMLCALCVLFPPLPAFYGLTNDLFECLWEIAKSERVKANFATLVLTAGYIAGAILAAIAVYASNPAGWAALAVFALGTGVALLVKMTRMFLNGIDASLDKNSLLAKDSRFQLSPVERGNLVTKGYNDNQIANINIVIAGLAILAQGKLQYGLFGSKNNYLEVISLLNEVKSGNIPRNLAFNYGLDSSGKPIQNIPYKDIVEWGGNISTGERYEIYEYSYPNGY